MTTHRLEWRILALALWAIAFTLVSAPRVQVAERHLDVTVEVVAPEAPPARRVRLLAELARGREFATLAAAELAEARDPEALALLADQAVSPTESLQAEQVATSAVLALGRYEHPVARRALYQVAVDEQAGARRYHAVRALRRSPRIEDARILREALRTARAQDDALAFDEAAEALADLGVPLHAAAPAHTNYS